MRHTPPTAPSILAAVPLAAPCIVVPGYRIETLPLGTTSFIDRWREPVPAVAPVKAKRAPRRKLTPSENLALIDSIPNHSDDVNTAQRLYPTIEYYKHVPTIHLTRDGKTVLVTGPVEPIAPRMDKTTAMGWGKWREDSAAFEAAQTAKSKAHNARIFKALADMKVKAAARREAAYQLRCDRAHAAGKPTPARPKFKPAPPGGMTFSKDPEVRALGHAANQISSVASRRRRFHQGRATVAGRHTAPITEQFERAHGSPSTAFRTALCITPFDLFNSALPRLAEIVYGYDKTVVHENRQLTSGPNPVFVITRDGMSVRDMEYIQVDGRRRCMFIVDLDGWWADIEQLLTALRRLLPPEFMPNLITGRGHETLGGWENPHLCFLLPPGARVIKQKGKPKKSEFKLHSMIQRGIVNHLIELGADPFHTNVDKTKNPLTPKWNVACQDEHFATMSEWKAFLPTITPDIRKMRAKAKKVKALRECTTPEEITLSSAIFTDGLHARGFLIRAAQRTQDPAFLKARKTHHGFVNWLYHPTEGVITRRLVYLHQDTPAVRSVLAAQREFVEQHGDTPGPSGQFCNRGRDEYNNLAVNDYAVPDATYSAIERKLYMDDNRKRAGTRTQWFKKELHMGLMAEEIERRMATGLTIDEVEAQRADVVKTLDKAGLVGRSTAYRLWDYVVLVVALASRYHAGRTAIVPEPVCHPVEATQSSCQQSKSGPLINVPAPSVQPVKVVPARSPVIRRNPTSISPAEAAGIRRSWASTVAAWRKAVTAAPADTDMVLIDLTKVDDPIVKAVLLIEAQGQSGWTRRRH